MTDGRFGLTEAGDRQPPRVTACGDIDLANVNDFRDLLEKAAANAPAITVDLSRVSYCDSAAVRALFSVAATAELTLVVPARGPIKTLLKISGLDRVATVSTSN